MPRVRPRACLGPTALLLGVAVAGLLGFLMAAFGHWPESRFAEPTGPSTAIVKQSRVPTAEVTPLDADAAQLFLAAGKGARADRVAPPARLDWQPQQLMLAASAIVSLPALQNVALGIARLDAEAPSFLETPPTRPPDTGLDLGRAAIGAAGGKPLYFGGLSEAEFRAKEKRCLATAIYFEARGEPIEGQLAVAQTIMNRVRSAFYPDTICGVVYQGAERPNACQFSFACDRVADVPKQKPEWETANELAGRVVDGKVWLAEVGYASHYHATTVRPDWIGDMRRLTRIGAHIFYRAKFLPVDDGTGRASVE